MTISLLSCFSFKSISAEENTNYFDSVTVEETNEFEEMYTFESKNDDASYLVLRNDDYVEIYNKETSTLIGRMEVIQGEELPSIVLQSKPVNKSQLSQLALSYNSWGTDWAFLRRDTLRIDGVEYMTLDAILAVLGAYFGTSLINDLTYYAIGIYNYRYAGLDVDVYFRNNDYCIICSKEKYVFFDEVTGIPLDTDDSNPVIKVPVWNGDPWDYSEPAACRVLAQELGS